MKRYGIECTSLPVPGQWFFLEDSDHAIRHAKEIYCNAKVLFYFFKQHHDFKAIWIQVKATPGHDLDKLAFIAFQNQFQRECLEQIGRLYTNAYFQPTV